MGWETLYLYLEPRRAGKGHVARVAGVFPVVLGQVALGVVPQLRQHRERFPAFCIKYDEDSTLPQIFLFLCNEVSFSFLDSLCIIHVIWTETETRPPGNAESLFRQK